MSKPLNKGAIHFSFDWSLTFLFFFFLSQRAPGTGAAPDESEAAADKYIVFGSCLKKLLKRCSDCFSMNTQVSFDLVGSMVKATTTCGAGHTSIWESQPKCHGKPEGNILMCSGIVFSGGCPTKVLRLFDIMGVARIHSTQFNEYQRCYVLPAVMNVSSLDCAIF